jgi:hypothetical protein
VEEEVTDMDQPSSTLAADRSKMGRISPICGLSEQLRNFSSVNPAA